MTKHGLRHSLTELYGVYSRILEWSLTTDCVNRYSPVVVNNVRGRPFAGDMLIAAHPCVPACRNASFVANELTSFESQRQGSIATFSH